jgi:hypothetical protein
MDNSSELLIFYAISSKMEMKELLKFLQDFSFLASNLLTLFGNLFNNTINSFIA